MHESKPASAAEREPLIAALKQLGDSIVHFTAGKNEAGLVNSSSAYLPYADGSRFAFIYKEEGANKIGPEFAVMDQYAEGAESLKSITFRWPEKYPEDKTTWGLTVIDHSLPEGQRRRSIPGSGLKDEDVEQISSLVDKARMALGGA